MSLLLFTNFNSDMFINTVLSIFISFPHFEVDAKNAALVHLRADNVQHVAARSSPTPTEVGSMNIKTVKGTIRKAYFHNSH